MTEDSRRQRFTKTFERHHFTDDPSFVSEARWMDQKVIEAQGPVGANWAQYGSYGPTVGVCFNQQ